MVIQNTSVDSAESLHYVSLFSVLYHCVIPESESNRSNLTPSLSGAVCYKRNLRKVKVEQNALRLSPS